MHIFEHRGTGLRGTEQGENTVGRRGFVRGVLPAMGALGLSLLMAGCKSPDASSGGGGGTAPTTTGGQAKPYTGDTILLGEYSSLTGTTATFGESTDNAIKMAINEQNDKGGLIGHQIEVKVVDDASQPQQASSAVQSLIYNSNVLAVLGEVASSRSLAAAPICQKAGVPMLSPASTNPKVTQVGNYIFRACFIDPFQGKVMSTFARQVLKAKKAAIITDQANDYSKGLTQVFTADWTAHGGTIVSQQYYSEGDKAFQAQITQVQGTDPDVIFVPGYYTEVGAIAKQARTQGLHQPLLGGDGWDSPKLYEIGGAAVQGCYFSNHYSADSTDPRVRKFVDGYKKLYSETPDALAAVAYDASYIMFDAIKRASTDGKTIPTRAALRDALAKTKNYPGVTGNISMDADRNAKKPAVVLKVQGNKAVFVQSVQP